MNFDFSNIGTMIWKTIFAYLFILLIMRIMGKRELGHLSVFDLIVSLMIADLSSIVIESEKGIIRAILPIIVLCLLQVTFAHILLKFPKVRSLLEGEPTVVIKNGKIQDGNMNKMRYNNDDLMMQLRDKDIADIADVEFAILETSGTLSVFPKSETKKVTKGRFQLPVAVIIQGKLQPQGLKKVGKSEAWLKVEILRHGYNSFQDVYYASLDCNGKLFVDGIDKH